MIGIHENDTSEHDKRINGIVTNGYMDKWNIGKWEVKYGKMKNEKWKMKNEIWESGMMTSVKNEKGKWFSY